MSHITQPEWAKARQLLARSLRSSLHCSIATTNHDGSPHVTPIGSLMLGSEPGTATYFDVFNRQLGHNLASDPRVTILAVDSGRKRWLRALLSGSFESSPAAQLVGTVSAARPATDQEIERFRQAVKPLMKTKGGKALWSNASRVRDVSITEIVPIRLGKMIQPAMAS